MITDADREAAEQVLGEMVLGNPERAAKIIAAHRIAALEDGARLMQEAATEKVIGFIHPDWPRLPGEAFATSQVMALDPAAIVKERG